MKKSTLHTAIHAAISVASTAVISTALLSSSVLYTQAYADNIDFTIPASLANDEDSDTGYVSYGSDETDFYTEMFSYVVSTPEAEKKNKQKDTLSNKNVATVNTGDGIGNISRVNSASESKVPSNIQHNSVQVAQLGEITSVIENTVTNQHDQLLDILTADLSLDVYFRSGSTDIESFYTARLVAIADLINTMDGLEIHLDGYTDRRGDKSQNIALANDRIESVRQQLIDAGIDENSIISKAFGEMKMVSAAGDLDGYTFDRKVVIRFQRMTVDSIHNMNNSLSEMDTEDTSVKNISPVLADAGNRF